MFEILLQSDVEPYEAVVPLIEGSAGAGCGGSDVVGAGCLLPKCYRISAVSRSLVLPCAPFQRNTPRSASPWGALYYVVTMSLRWVGVRVVENPRITLEV